MRKKGSDKKSRNVFVRSLSLFIIFIYFAMCFVGCGTQADDFRNDEAEASKDSNTYKNGMFHSRERVISLDKVWDASWEETIFNHEGKPLMVFTGTSSWGFDGGTRDLSTYSVYSYDASGNELSYERYSESELEEWCYSYYDLDGKLFKEDRSGEYSDEFIINEYDALGNLLREEQYDKDAEAGDYDFCYEYIYDSEGKLITQNDYTSKDDFVYRTADYFYDDDGNLSKVVNYSYEHVDGWYEYTYDASGNVLMESWFEQNDYGSDEYLRKEYSYDSQGRELTYTEYNVEDDEVEESYERKYDENGNLIYYREGSAGHTEYSYDEYGNLLAETYINSNGEKEYEFKYYYEYDDDGNVLSCEGHLGEKTFRSWSENGESFNEEVWLTQLLYRQVLDEDGRELELYIYNTLGEVSMHSKSTYDKKGRELSTVEYDGEDNVLYAIEYVYDRKGDELSCVICDGEGNEVFSWDYPSYEEEDENAVDSHVMERLDYQYLLNRSAHTYLQSDGYIVDESCYHLYDEHGNELQYQVCGSEGELIYYYETEYDAENLVQSFLIDDYETEINGDITRKYLYNEDGLIIRCDEYYEYEPEKHSAYSFGYENGKLTKCSYRDDARFSFTTCNGEIECEYDEVGKLVSIKFYDLLDGVLVQKKEFTREYNENGALVAASIIDGSGMPYYNEEYRYDSNGHLLKIEVFNENGELEEWADVTCDAAGNVLRETWYDANGTFDMWISYTYTAFEEIQIAYDLDNIVIAEEIMIESRSGSRMSGF